MKVISFETTREMREAIDSNDYNISKSIVEELKKKIHYNKPFKIISLYVKDVDSYLDFDLDPEDFEECLNLSLQNFEKNEDYEGCADIINMLEYLKEKNR